MKIVQLHFSDLFVHCGVRRDVRQLLMNWINLSALTQGKMLRHRKNFSTLRKHPLYHKEQCCSLANGRSARLVVAIRWPGFYFGNDPTAITSWTFDGDTAPHGRILRNKSNNAVQRRENIVKDKWLAWNRPNTAPSADKSVHIGTLIHKVMDGYSLATGGNTNITSKGLAKIAKFLRQTICTKTQVQAQNAKKTANQSV
ncbi:hypothetical protein BC940DRAFT_338244 [Gongronella butleri]|nr:hypothetical protein BC940DRAFT_338244 [Gongronella butleri]